MSLTLAQALQVSFQSKSEDGVSCYRCELNPNWSILAVPQGGFSLGVIIESCIQHQSGSSHADPIYLSAFFPRATKTGPGQVRVKLLKSGRNITNLFAELVQQGTTRITAHLLFGDLSPSQHAQQQHFLAPPSPYARRVPLYSHPSKVSYDAIKPSWAKYMDLHMSVDPIYLGLNDPKSAARTTAESVGGGGTVWGAWCELARKDDKLTASSIPFFCDASTNLPDLLPDSEPGSSKGKERSASSQLKTTFDLNALHSWCATIAMTVEFKSRLPSFDNHSSRTVGLYSESRFLTNPEKRHNARVEVWTAPCEIGQGQEGDVKGWRDRQYCVAIADQIALVLPSELRQHVGRNSAKL